MFEAGLKRAVKELLRAQKKELLHNFVLIGGLAVSRWSVPRATADIDFAVSLGDGNLKSLAAALKGKARLGTPSDPLLGVVSAEIKDSGGPLQFQLVQFPPAWEEVAFKDISQTKLGTVKVPIADWKAMVLLKLYAGGPLDLQDAANIIRTVAPKKRELNYLLKRSESLRVSRRLNKLLPT